MEKELAPNTSISHYRIISKIGAGGMGEVYRAYDSRLDREVAIKVLPSELSRDDDRLRRFQQEAKATSALNHPNILIVYDIGEHEGSPFIVAELLDGEELRQRLDEGPIPLRKTIDYARQIVSGLSAAHEKGIVHRDLKPENLFITKDDRVKILDFGLAKLRERDSDEIHGSEDATRRALTNPGVVMGTVGYMSPEQVRGQETDNRSDIFSFGVILYEMLTGKRAFTGDSVVELMNAILKEDVPDSDELISKVPPSFEKIMRRCLEKKPEHRFYSAHDLGFALEATSTPSSSSGTLLAASAPDGSERASPPPFRWHSRLAWLAAGLFLLSTLILSALYFRRGEMHERITRFAVVPPEKSYFNEAVALSPDGQMLAFASTGLGGATSLWVRQLDSVEPRQLPGTEGASFPFWSPDGRSIGFFAGAKLRKVDAAGGAAQTLADASTDPRGGTWLSDGTIVFSPGTLSALMRVPAAGGPVSEITKLQKDRGETSHRWPYVMPDGKHFIYFARGSTRDQEGLYAASIDSTEGKFLVATPVAGMYAESAGKGYLLFVRESILMAQPFDARRMELSGEAQPIVQGILSYPTEIGPTAYAAFSAVGGELVYRKGDRQTTRLAWYDRSGKLLGEVSEAGGHHEPSVSKDGKRILFGRAEGVGYQDIFLTDLSRGNTTRLTFDPAADATATWSPDETQFVYFSNRSGHPEFYRKSSSGGGNDELLLSFTVNAYPDNWSRDGKYLLYEQDGGSKNKLDLWVLPMTGEPKPFPYLQSEFVEAHAQFSPDGRWVAYTSDESGRSEVYVQSFPANGGKWQISTTGGDQPQWRGDGKELFYLSPDRSLMSVTVTGGTSFDFSRPAPLFQTNVPVTGITDDRNNFVCAQDGQRFLINGLADNANSEPLTLVLNWTADITK